MIYVTCTTRNRFWYSALTALSIAQGNWAGCFVHVLDDASDDNYAEAKEFLFLNMVSRGLIQRYERLPEQIGFCGGRELLVERFMNQNDFTHWFHLDDDILIAPHTLTDAMQDMRRVFRDEGVLQVYVNPWCNWKKWEGQYATVSKIGGACFLVPKVVIRKIGNPYEGQTDGEEANARWWRTLRKENIGNFIRWTNCYPCQHTGNVESTLFGHTPQWERFYAKDLRTEKLIEVPPFQMDELRAAIKSRKLNSYVARMNAACRIQIKLPAPGSLSNAGIRQ